MAAAGSCRAKAPRGVAGWRRPRAAVLGAERRSRAAAVRPVDEEVSSDSEPESPSLGRRRRREAAVEEEVEETPQEKKLRLAKLYLEELRQHEEERAAAEEEEETHPADLIGDRLKEDVLEQKGRLQRLVAKDATGDRNKLIMVWDTATCKRLHIFTGHRDAVSGLSFRKGTHQLYSASHDRCVKVWNVAENADMETLFGHQDVITGLDSLSRECCVTAGGRDGTVRLWKIPEESQLVFYGHQGSIDCIQLINEEHMVSGADDGSVALWGLAKKKPLALARQAHGMQDAQGVQQPYWISAVAALRNSDLLATGSHSANVKLWKCSEGFRKLEPLWAIPLVGFVNSLEFSAAGDFLVAGLGQEHRYRPPSPALAGGTASTASRARWRVTPISLICRLGRWWRIKEAKNSICIIPLKRRATAPSSHVPDSS
ncbi:U3 small nucleolar RNA-interacting protein 2-like isoform X6 [Phalacrocorax aristotelis]|uniref:U3 small nucleolar RNA-interacting protein 2-like isoform X6 n=1 Tax=Phalacrocorax aristotelis TaxID=126867 RepID=UPI003F4B722C